VAAPLTVKVVVLDGPNVVTPPGVTTGAVVSLVIVPSEYDDVGPADVFGPVIELALIDPTMVPSEQPENVITYTVELVELTEVEHPVAVPVRVMSLASKPDTATLYVTVDVIVE